jgi:predicted nucleic acid-binding protein
VYQRTSAQIAPAFTMLLKHQTLVVQEPDVVRAALERLIQAPSQALGFSDCLILEVARKAGHVPLATFDLQLGKQPGARRVR